MALAAALTGLEMIVQQRVLANPKTSKAQQLPHFGAPHSHTASLMICGRARSLRLSANATSTGHPRRSSSSTTSPLRSKRLRPRSIRRLATHRETEPRCEDGFRRQDHSPSIHLAGAVVAGNVVDDEGPVVGAVARDVVVTCFDCLSHHVPAFQVGPSIVGLSMRLW